MSSKSRATSESESGTAHKSFHQNTSVLGSLKSVRSRRRSKSASSITTPLPRGGMSTMKGRTPLGQQAVPHTSRSKYRTPVNQVRQKAMSADRINYITPKVNPSNPISMFRHPRAGEAVFSITGSPIVPSK